MTWFDVMNKCEVTRIPDGDYLCQSKDEKLILSQNGEIRYIITYKDFMRGFSGN